jgi:hypothetical protein
MAVDQSGNYMGIHWQMLPTKGSRTKNETRVVCRDIREEAPEYSSMTFRNPTAHSDRRLSSRAAALKATCATGRASS